LWQADGNPVAEEGTEMMGPSTPGPDRGVYGISTAAQRVGLGPPNVRPYEQRGRDEPYRTQGGTPPNSPDDQDRLRRIAELLGDGLNLAGIGMVLDLEDDNARLQADNTRLRCRSR
jgi:DNA-binding transcriptional MerR regulator